MTHKTPDKLFDEFEKDILYDCHALVTRINRSPAAREIIRRGPAILKDVSTHLKDYKPPTTYELLGKQLKHAWGVLLSWLADEHHLKDKPTSQRDFPTWVNWAAQFPTHPA